MAPLITFAFGPDESFLFETPQGTCFRRLGWAFMASRVYAKRYYSLSLGPGEHDYAGFYLESGDKVKYSMNYPYEPLLKAATEWLVDTWKGKGSTAVTRSRLIVAPKGKAYVAITPTAARWGPDENLPEELLGILRTCIVDGFTTIAELSLGMGGSWWLKFRDGSCRWDLAGLYRELDDVLYGGGVDPNSVEFISLSPYNASHYFLSYERYKIRYSLPAQFATEVSEAIEAFYASLQTVSRAHEPPGSVGKATTAGASTGAE